jgi:anti-anti-sigma regulatory factor
MLDILFHPSPASHLLPSFIRSVEDVGGVRILRLRGPVGKEIGGDVQKAEDAAKATPGVFSRPLLLDFKETTAWDSSTVAYLIRAMRRRVEAHAPVAILNPPPKLLAELEISRLLELFPVYHSEDEALEKLVSSTGGPRTDR